MFRPLNQVRHFLFKVMAQQPLQPKRKQNRKIAKNLTGPVAQGCDSCCTSVHLSKRLEQHYTRCANLFTNNDGFLKCNIDTPNSVDHNSYGASMCILNGLRDFILAKMVGHHGKPPPYESEVAYLKDVLNQCKIPIFVIQIKKDCYL